MAESNAWRLECCNVLANALADDPQATLVIQVIPFSRRGFSGRHVLSISVYNHGRTLASCRHEVAESKTHWFETCERLLWTQFEF